MPLNLLENMPEDLKRRNMLFDYRYVQVPKIKGAIISGLEDHNKNSGHHIRVPSFSPSIAADMKVILQLFCSFKKNITVWSLD